MLHSIRSKVLVASISITLITALVITLVFYLKSSQMIEDNYGENLYGRIEQAGEAFDNALKEMYYIDVQSSCDEELIGYINEYRQNGDDAKLEDMASLLGEFQQRYSDINSVYLVLPDSSVIVTSQDYPIYAKGIKSENIQQIASVHATEAGPVLIEDPFRMSPIFLSFIEGIINENGEVIGYLMVNVQERTLYYKYIDPLYDGKASETVLLSRDSRIISTKDITKIGKEYFNEELGSLDKSGIRNKWEGSELGVYYRTTFSECGFLSIIEKKEIISDLDQIRIFQVAILSLFLAISAIATFFITGAVYRPLKKLTETMDEISEGNLDTRVSVETNDEIGHLSENFNNMLDHIRDLIDQLVREQILKKDAELEALQYQITPHFMYNTLNSIKFAALIRGEKELGGLIGDFVELLQASINKKGTFITVADELHILKNYINLQQFRYEGNFDIEYQVDCEAKGCFLPRLLLQPMVENSILHGLDMKNKNSKIVIRAEVKSDILCLSVIDNGRGMTQEQIKELLTKKTKKISGLSGIGVANVQERLELYYGKDAGIFYESSEKETTALIFLPAYKEQNKYSI